MKNNLSLQALFTHMLEAKAIAPSREATIASSLNQYGLSLGCEGWESCYPETYNLAADERNRLIALSSVRTKRSSRNRSSELSRHTVRNRKNDVSYVLEYAYQNNLLPPPGQPPTQVDQVGQGPPPSLGETTVLKKYRIDPVPEKFNKEIGGYRNWCTTPTVLNRPQRLKRRKITQENVEEKILQYAGFLVQEKQISPKDLSLLLLIEPQHWCDFVSWYIENKGQTTSTVVLFLAHIQALLNYLIITCQNDKRKKVLAAHLETLKNFKDNLDQPVTVRDKDARWLSLTELHQVACMIYPTNAQQILKNFQAALESPEQELQKYLKPRAAKNATLSMMIEMVLHAPMRQRNLREMLFDPINPEKGKNLYRKEGRWHIRFTGEENKIEKRKRRVNVYHLVLPVEINEKLEEYLFQWRPMLLANQSETDRGTEKTKRKDVKNQEFVFLNQKGRPFISQTLCEAFRTATYRCKKVAVPPHMIRTIWATEYLLENRDVIVAAYMLGDTIETVLKHYSHLLEKDAENKARAWLAKKLQPKTTQLASVSQSVDLLTIRAMRNLAAKGLSDEEIFRRLAA